jgi:hypothetical protein
LRSRPEDPRQRRTGLQSVLQPEPIRAELERHPAESPIRLEEQPVDGLTEDRTGPARPDLTLDDAVPHNPQLVGIEFDDGAHAAGQGPCIVVFVDQVVLAVALRQRGGQLCNQIGGRDTGGQRMNRRRDVIGGCLDTHLRRGR